MLVLGGLLNRRLEKSRDDVELNWIGKVPVKAAADAMLVAATHCRAKDTISVSNVPLKLLVSFAFLNP